MQLKATILALSFSFAATAFANVNSGARLATRAAKGECMLPHGTPGACEVCFKETQPIGAFI